MNGLILEMRLLNTVRLATALLVAQISTADAGTAVTGPGTATCAEYANLYKRSPKSTDSVFLSWAQGFLSGMNSEAILAHRPTADLGSLSLDEQGEQIRLYCDEHPLGDYVQAVLTLFYRFSKEPDPSQAQKHH